MSKERAVRWMKVLVGAVMAAALVGCASGAPHPLDTIEAYRQAVEDKDAKAVYKMLDESARMGMDEEAFAEYFKLHYSDIRAQAKVLEKRASKDDGLKIEAQVPVAGSVAPVVWQDEQWFLARETPTRASQDTPRDTLEALLRALDARDLESVMGLLSLQQRTVYVQEMDVMRDSLEQGLGQHAIITNGDTAILPLANGDKIILVREGGAWKLQGYEQSQE